MSRVALVLPGLGGGGAQRVFLDLGGELAAMGCDVELVVACDRGELRGASPEGVRVVQLGARVTSLAVGPLALHLRRARPDAVLSALTNANLITIAAARIARSDATLAVSEHLNLSTSLLHARDVRTRVAAAMIRRAYPLADRVVAVSRGVAADLARTTGLPPASIDIAFNPIPVDLLRARAAEPLDHPWAADGEPPVVLAVGRLTAQKDFATLLDAFAAARRQEPCRLVILGEGEDRNALEQQVRRLGLEDAVQLPGFAANPYPWFRVARVLAMSSRFEGLPTVLLEALALGLRVVSTDCPSGPREILRDGRLGRLVAVGDPDALAGALVAALRDPSVPDPDLAIARFRPRRVAERYAALLGVAPG